MDPIHFHCKNLTVTQILAFFIIIYLFIVLKEKQLEFHFISIEFNL